MRQTRATAAILAAALVFAVPSFAQQQRARVAEQAVQPARDVPAATVTGVSAEETRRDLEELLKQYPPSLPRVLRLDPTLLSSPEYLKPYPALAAFLAQRPEVVHNPGYFFGTETGYRD